MHSTTCVKIVQEDFHSQASVLHIFTYKVDQK